MRNRIESLQGLRGIAILLVMWAHLNPSVFGVARSVMREAREIVKPGYVGVDLFFVLSGFLITRILLHEHAAGSFSYGRFMTKRMLRIVPIYLLTLLGIWAVMGRVQFYYFVYIQNYFQAFGHGIRELGHTWSLAVEEQFYLTFPLLFLMRSRRTIQIAVFAVLPLALVSTLVIALLVPDVLDAKRLIYRSTTCRMWSIGLGAALACIEPLLVRENKRFLAIGGAAMVAGGAVVWWSDLSLPGAWFEIVVMFGSGIACAGTVTVAYCLESRGGILHRALTSRPLTFIGLVSYGLYLYHLPIHRAFLVTEVDTRPAAALAAVSLSLLAATVSYFAIEKPILGLKKRLAPEPSSTGTT